ncbi:hypothetical protein FF1_025768 [Malus domestica]
MDVASFANRDQELGNEDPINEEVLSSNENNCGDGDVAAERTKGKVAAEPNNVVAREMMYIMRVMEKKLLAMR